MIFGYLLSFFILSLKRGKGSRDQLKQLIDAGGASPNIGQIAETVQKLQASVNESRKLYNGMGVVSLTYANDAEHFKAVNDLNEDVHDHSVVVKSLTSDIEKQRKQADDIQQQINELQKQNRTLVQRLASVNALLGPSDARITTLQVITLHCTGSL